MTAIADFLGGLGVNTHMDATTTPYGDVALVQASLAYIGVSLIRDHAYSVDLNAYQTLAAAGVQFDLILDDVPQTEIDNLLPVAPAIGAFEGPNEVDYQPILTNDIADPVAAAVAEQMSVYAAVKGTPEVSGVPVVNVSLATTANIPEFAGTLTSADYANLHTYSPAGDPPQPAIADDLAQAMAQSTLPVVLTETGYYTLPTDPDGVDESVQARLTLDTLFDSSALGIGYTFLYELFDEAADTTGNPQLHYGLFNVDGSPKLAATALHNLTTILATVDATPAVTPALSISTDGLPITGQESVFDSAGGAAVVAVWAEPQIWDSFLHQEVSAPTSPTTISFGSVAGSVMVFDPLVGTAPIAIYSDVDSVTVDITDHPILIEVTGEAATPPPSSPVVEPPVDTTPVATVPTTPVTDPPATPAPVPTGTIAGGTAPAGATSDTDPLPVYRFFDTTDGTHFYTADASEAASVERTRPDLVPESAGLKAVNPDARNAASVPVFRFFDVSTGSHFFTADPTERDTVIATRPDLSYEPSSVFYEDRQPQPGDVAVYRFFDTAHGTHFYTADPSERATIIATRSDLVGEGIAFYEPGA